ncbi:hypothetical protein CLOSCI_00971 [[Clostridium] scindens ATCC 35704]|nr:hypothetical protein CLOSCI_00971 [[Clostridium] scindens ATCC 35704]
MLFLRTKNPEPGENIKQQAYRRMTYAIRLYLPFLYQALSL